MDHSIRQHEYICIAEIKMGFFYSRMILGAKQFFPHGRKCNFMLISEKTTGSIYSFIFRVKRAYPIVRQLEKKNNCQKSPNESSKMREKQMLGP